ncbi:MAG TPA: zinc ribbon domain-containing protein [Anaerolineae bacterium]
MDTFALFIGAAIAAFLFLFIGQPLRRTHPSAETGSQLDTLIARRESLYTQIRELDFDHATGKVTDADYAPIRDRLKTEAAGVLRQIDELLTAMPTAVDDLEQAIAARRKRKPAAADADLEAAIATRRKRKPATAGTGDADLEAAIAARRKALACHNCGKPLNPGDAFCSKCGAPVATQVAR